MIASRIIHLGEKQNISEVKEATEGRLLQAAAHYG